MTSILNKTKGRKLAYLGSAAVIAGALSLVAVNTSSASNIPGLASLSPSKAANLQKQIDAQRTLGSSNHATQSESQGLSHASKSAVPGSQLPFPTGIQQTRQAPFTSSHFIVSNQWHTIYNGQEYLVLCGSTSNPSGGTGTSAVDVWKNIISGDSVQTQEIGIFQYAPAGSQELTASNANGAVVTLSYQGGTVNFNLATDSFATPG